MSAVVPPPIGPDIRIWARQLSTFLARYLTRLAFKTSDMSAAEDGVMLWDGANGYPVMSKNGEWREVVLADGDLTGIITSDVTAAAVDTAYGLQFTDVDSTSIYIDGSNPTRIVFPEGGHYEVAFSAQIASSSSSTVTFRFWPRLNGTNLSGSTMVNTLHSNGATIVVARTAHFNLNAGDYLEAMWAVDSLSATLSATAATAYAPAAPAATISIMRLHA